VPFASLFPGLARLYLRAVSGHFLTYSVGALGSLHFSIFGALLLGIAPYYLLTHLGLSACFRASTSLRSHHNYPCASLDKDIFAAKKEKSSPPTRPFFRRIYFITLFFSTPIINPIISINFTLTHTLSLSGVQSFVYRHRRCQDRDAESGSANYDGS